MMDAPTATATAPCARLAIGLDTTAIVEFEGLTDDNSSEPMRVLLTVHMTENPETVPDPSTLALPKKAPVRVVLVGDVSMSMDVGGNLEAMRSAMLTLVEGALVARGASLAVFEFGSKVHRLTPSFLDLSTEEGRVAAKDAIASMGKTSKFRSGTNISGASEMALQALVAEMDGSDQALPSGVVCLLTDGQPNSGLYHRTRDGPKLGVVLRNIRGPRSISFSTMALGTAPQRAYLKGFTTGAFAFSSTAKELGDAYESVSASFDAPEHNLSLVVSDADGVRSLPLGMMPQGGTEPLFTVNTNVVGPAFKYALVVGVDVGITEAPSFEGFEWTNVELPRAGDATVQASNRASREGGIPDELQDAIARDAVAVEVSSVIKRARECGGQAAYDELLSLRSESSSLGARRQRTTSLVDSMVSQLGGRLLSNTSSFVSVEAPEVTYRGRSTPYDAVTAAGASDLLGLEAEMAMEGQSQSFF